MDYKAFVSSTFLDLKDHRAHVIRELRKAGFFVDPMEEWTSAAQEPKVLSTNRLDDCTLCVFLVARRRGNVPDGETRSITQLEVEEARRRGIDVLPFLLDDDALWKTEWDERGTDERLRQWRADIQNGKHGTPDRFNHEPDSIHITPALVRWVKDKGDGERTQIALDLYLKLVEQEHGTIQFLGLPQLKDNPNAPIHRLYVEPAVAPRWISPDVDPNEWPETKPVLDVVAEHKRLVILGDPGSGKSTLVSWIAWQLARHHRDGASPWTERLGRLVPLPFILRDLGIGKGVTWDSLLAAFLDSPKGKLLALADLPKLLRDGQAIILLDGLDEIGNPAIRRDLRDAVWAEWIRTGQFLSNDKKCRWLLTSRVVGYEEESFTEFRRFLSIGQTKRRFVTSRAGLKYVAPFDDPRVEQFVDNWFVLREDSEWKRQRMARELVEAVRADDSTKKLGRIPNLLTMMALIYRVRARLPHGRALLYNEIAQAYLETIDWFRKIQVRTERLVEKKRWLARVGFELQRRRTADVEHSEEEKEILATGDHVRAWIAAEMAESGKEGSDEDAAGFVDFLAKRSGLLLPRGQDRFAFLHLSFQEYFAACLLAQKIVTPAWLMGDQKRIPHGATKDDLQRYANNPVWRETLVFLVELLAAEQQDWLPVARDCLFGPDLANVAAENDENQNRVVLLARLVIDPQAGFDSTERERAIRACCQWEVATQKRKKGDFWGPKNAVARTLLTAEKADRKRITRLLAEEARATGLISLDLSQTWVQDLQPLAGLANLQSLDVGGTGVQDIQPLAGLANLQRLSLSYTLVQEVQPLAELASLQEVDLQGTRIQNVQPMASLANLHVLNLRETWVHDLQPLASLANLWELELSRTPVQDVQPLAALPNLKKLGLSDTKVKDVRPLAGLANLHLLDLRGTGIHDLQPLAGLANLRELYLSGTPVQDVHMLAGLVNLQVLDLCRTRLTEDQVRVLRIRLPECYISIED